MNKELDLEAKTYSQSIHKNPSLRLFREYSTQDFIAGATSKWVEKQKLEFAIKQLKEIRSKMTFFEIANMENTLDNLYSKIQELEQKLSEL